MVQDNKQIIERVLQLAAQIGKFPSCRDLAESGFRPSYSSLLRLGIRLEDVKPLWDDIKPKAKCLQCGEDIVSEHAKKFCSRSCAAKYNNGKRVACKTALCKHCGKLFKPHSVSRGMFCSGSCSSNHRNLVRYN